jgi:hypothetical protein
MEIKKFFKKVTGLQALEDIKMQALAEAELAKNLAQKHLDEAADAEKKADIAKLTPKERATHKGEPYVAVLETHVNKENLRNGFLELDWNDLFVLQLKQQGYGFDGDPDEEIVDRWFRTLCRDIAGEEGVDMTERGAGYINVKKIAEGKSEVS